MYSSHPPEIRHFTLGQPTATVHQPTFAVVTQRVFPGIAGGLLGISLQLTLFTFNTFSTVTVTPDVNWKCRQLKEQKGKL